MSTILRSGPWLDNAADEDSWDVGVVGTRGAGKTTTTFVVDDARPGGYERVPVRQFSVSGLHLWSGIYDAGRIKKAAPVLASAIAWYNARQEGAVQPVVSADWCIPRGALTWLTDDQDFYRLPVGRGDQLAPLFESLAEQWEDDTWAYSFIERKVLHPAYQRIIGMGHEAVPLILVRLEDRGPDHWFWALEMITGENPAEGTETMEDATRAWLAWGHEIGYI